MIKDDGTVIHFNNPKVRSRAIQPPVVILLIQVQASLAANTFAVTGHAENKRKHFSITQIQSICISQKLQSIRLSHSISVFEF